MENNSSPLVVIQKVEYINHNHVDLEHLVHELRKLNHSQNESFISITNKINSIMANEQQFKDALARIETATTAAGTAATAIQARIDALTAAIQNAGLPADVEATLLAQLEGTSGNVEALASALTAMGSVSNPIPEPVPEPVPPV